MYTLTFRFQILLLLFCFGGASVVSAQTEGSKKILVVSTSSIIADMASNIGGSLIESVSIVPVGEDPHVYKPTSKDAKLLADADLILQNGLNYEAWIDELIKNSNTKARVVTLTEGIIPIVSKKYQHATDPHAWMDPVNGKIYAHNIKNALLQLLPEHNEQIVAQFDAFLEELYKLDEYTRKSIAKIDTNKRILITSHDSFLYFGRQYGLKLESVLGTSTDTDVDGSHLSDLNEIILSHSIPVVFSESTIKPKLIKKVSKENNISIGGELYSDSLGDKGSPADTYVKMIRHNTDVIVAGLTSTMTNAGAFNPGKISGVLIFIVMAVMLVFAGIFFLRRRILAL